jgi:hypothetical protein
MCVMQKDSTIVFDFDKSALNDIFGLREDEMFMVALSASIETEQETKQIKEKFPFVSGCDFLETNSFIEDAYKKSVSYPSQDIKELDFFEGIDESILKYAILNRRSIRAFKKIAITNDDFLYLIKNIFDFATKYCIDIFYTVHTVEDKAQGLYKNQKLLKKGDFSKKSKYLSLEQNIGGESAVTFYFTSNEKEAYQKVNILSGFLAQIIYLKSVIKDIGCTGIGAYYDDEVKEFLETNNTILYLLAIGK